MYFTTIKKLKNIVTEIKNLMLSNNRMERREE